MESNATARVHTSRHAPWLVAAVVVAACAGPPPAPPSAAGGVRLLVDAVEIGFAEPRVLAIDDDNEHFQVTVRGLVAGDADTVRDVMLQRDGLRLVCSGWARDGDTVWFVFPANAQRARDVAAALGVAVQPRAPWLGCCEGRLSASAPVVAGAAAVPLQFQLRNTGPVALWFHDGGRGRNRLGRDNRFTFAVERDGVPVAIEHVDDFGGLGSYRRLAPGEAWTFAVDLAHWCRVGQPGRYVVHAGYEAELMPAEFVPYATMPLGMPAHLQRVRTVSAELAFDVR